MRQFLFVILGFFGKTFIKKKEGRADASVDCCVFGGLAHTGKQSVTL